MVVVVIEASASNCTRWPGVFGGVAYFSDLTAVAGAGRDGECGGLFILPPPSIAPTSIAPTK